MDFSQAGLDPRNARVAHFAREANRQSMRAKINAADAMASEPRLVDLFTYVKNWISPSTNIFSPRNATISGIVTGERMEFECMNEECENIWSYPSREEYAAAMARGEIGKCPKCGAATNTDGRLDLNFENKLIEEIWTAAREGNFRFENLDDFQVFCGPTAFRLIPQVLKYKSDGVTLRATIASTVADNEWVMVKRYGA